MKRMVTDTMLMPAYVSRFSCIGGDCEDTCCAGWSITLDKESFHNYQSSCDPVLRPTISKYVKRNANVESEKDYGLILLKNDECQNCPFLSEEALCRIYERLGERALSDTCRNYPRQVHRIGDLHQMTLTLSCPEAARLALLEKDAFNFEGEEQTISLDSITRLKPEGGLTLAAMDDVRTLVFQVLRSQDISLSQRLKVIGRFCERLTELIQTHQTGALPGLLLSTEAELESGDAMALLAGQEELLDVQAQIAAVIFVAAQNTLPSLHVQKVFREVAQGLGIQEGVPLDGPALISAYEAGSRRLAPALEAVPWLLEHYLCNEALVEVFPWGRQSPRRNYATLIIRFVIVRLMLVGRAAAHAAPLSPFELAETIQVGCRRYDHDGNFNQNAVQGLIEAGWDSLERLYALI